MGLVSITRRGMHQKINRERGLARDYECVDCCSKANDWSHTHGTDRENEYNYKPRCDYCHAQYDIDSRIRGEDHYRSKLTEADVLEIRASSFSANDLAYIYDVTSRNIGDILRRKTWKHI